MAEVFRAELFGAEGFSRPVAIKRIQSGFSNDGAFSEMFKREARIAARLSHPNIASVFDFDRDERGDLFIVMELVEGTDLRTLVRTGPVPGSVTAFVVAELLRALGYAHDATHDGVTMRIVHRDISPHNILLSWDGAVKLTDFGIAKALSESPMTKTGVIKGKAAYLSPEQAAAKPLDHRSDLFAVGVVLHELLTHQRLFGVDRGAHDVVVMRRVLQMDVPDPREIREDVSGPLATLCMRLLERDPDRRPGSAKAALEALLVCPEITNRGPLDLKRLLRERFPQDRAEQSPVVPSGVPVGDFTDVDADSAAGQTDLELVAVGPTNGLVEARDGMIQEQTLPGAVRVGAEESESVTHSASRPSKPSDDLTLVATGWGAPASSGSDSRDDIVPATVVDTTPRAEAGGSMDDVTRDRRDSNWSMPRELDLRALPVLRSQDPPQLASSGDGGAGEPYVSEMGDLGTPRRSGRWMLGVLVVGGILAAVAVVGRRASEAPAVSVELAPAARPTPIVEPRTVDSEEVAPKPEIRGPPRAPPSRKTQLTVDPGSPSVARRDVAPPRDDPVMPAAPRPAALRDRLRAIGARLKTSVRGLPRNTVDELDRTYLDLRSAAQAADDADDWRRIELGLAAFEKRLEDLVTE